MGAINRKLEIAVNRRGEVIRNWARAGIPDGIGTGISPRHLMIQFRGQIPQHQGGGASNNAAITALELYERSEAALFDETVRLIRGLCVDDTFAALDCWVRFYTETGSQNAKAERLGLSRSSYINRLKCAEALIAGALITGGHYQTKRKRETCPTN